VRRDLVFLLMGMLFGFLSCAADDLWLIRHGRFCAPPTVERTQPDSTPTPTEAKP
jgi:hypothetical protein